MNNNFSFEDAFKRVLQDNADLRSGQIDTSKAMALHAGHVALDKLMNTAIKHYQVGLISGKPMSSLGGTVICGSIDEHQAIEGESKPIDQDSISAIANAPDPIKENLARKPKIGIVGLLPIQAGNVTSEFGQLADVVVWDDDSGQKSLSAMKNCDVVFFHTTHASHSTQEKLKSVGANIVPVNGAGTSMRLAIKKYFSK